MGDVVTCKCVLTKAIDPTRSDYLAFVLPDKGWREIACRPKGQPRRAEIGAQWEYEEKDGMLHLTPSLHCTDTGFHTDYNWTCAYEMKPYGADNFDHFFKINPEMKP